MAQVIIDKSYLDAASPSQVRQLCTKHTVLMADVLFYELMTTNERSRKHCFNKFPDTNNPVKLVPNVGSLLKYELDTHQPCTPLYNRCKKINFKFHKGLRAGTFHFTKEQRKGIWKRKAEVKQQTKEFFELAMMVHGFFPYLKRMPYNHFSNSIQKAKQEVATNEEKVREIYMSLLKQNVLPSNAIKPEALGPNWAHFRRIQIRVIYSLDLLLRYQGKLPTNTSDNFWRKIEHEMLDIEYVILGSLAGALASNDNGMIEKYQLVCPNGLLFTPWNCKVL